MIETFTKERLEQLSDEALIAMITDGQDMLRERIEKRQETFIREKKAEAATLGLYIEIKKAPSKRGRPRKSDKKLPSNTT